TWIIVGNIQSGCCRVGDRCLIMPNRTFVEVTNIYDDLIPLLRLYLTRDIGTSPSDSSSLGVFH
ncbi:unnamed protein product, partial [Rotaria sp. Silwood1]